MSEVGPAAGGEGNKAEPSPQPDGQSILAAQPPGNFPPESPAGPAAWHPLLRLLVFILMWRAFRFLALLVLYSLRRSVGPLRLQWMGEAGMAASAVIPTLIMAALEQRPFGSFGLPGRHALGKLFWAGALWGLGAVTIMMFGLHLAGGFDLGAMSLHGLRILKFAVFWGTFFLLVGFYEETLTRGYAQVVLARGIGFWPAAVLLSVGFGALHLGNPGESPVGITAVVVIGLFFCLTLRRTGSLWFAVGFHAAWDWGESFLYSVPDSGLIMPGHLLNSSTHGPAWLSGGTVGPEASVFSFAVIAATAIAFPLIYREVKFPT